MSDRLLKESDVLRIAFQLPYVVNSAFFDAIKALPSADKPQGEWIRDDDYHRCSNCHCVAPLDGEEYWLRDKIREELTEICPNCGAKMKGIDYENSSR